jgi:hypothetical protein
MDLTSAAVAFQQSSTISAIQTRVAKKILDVQRDQGDAAIQLINAATQNFAKAGDALVAAATGLGGEIDTYG